MNGFLICRDTSTEGKEGYDYKTEKWFSKDNPFDKQEEMKELNIAEIFNFAE